MMFKRLGNRKKVILQNTNAARKVFWSVDYLMNNICFYNLERLQRKCSSPQNTYGGINVYFQGFKLYCFTPPHTFPICFLRMDISFIKCFFRVIVAVCLNIILINLPKQPFIVKARGFTKNIVIRNRKKSISVSYDSAKNRLYHGLELITDSFTDYATVSFTAIYSKGLKF